MPMFRGDYSDNCLQSMQLRIGKCKVFFSYYYFFCWATTIPANMNPLPLMQWPSSIVHSGYGDSSPCESISILLYFKLSSFSCGVKLENKKRIILNNMNIENVLVIIFIMCIILINIVINLLFRQS